MKFSVTYPIVTHPYNPAFVAKSGIIRLATALDDAGFDGLAFTDHPVPTDRWLNAGGHDALDPFAALAFCAAVTERLKLFPNIAVLPYRNPFLTAKAAATVDVLSGGRFILAVATGYQKGEYKALGVDFDERNDLFDEAIEAIIGIWTTDDYKLEGAHFTALGNSANPKPTSQPYPPIWIGGNSKLARRRVAKYGNGWNPFPAARTLATTAKTIPLETLEDLAEMLDYLWQQVDDAGRDRSEIDIAFSNFRGGSPGTASWNADECLAGIEELERLGVTWVSAGLPGDDLGRAVEAAEQYATEVIAQLR
jgi:probable F420-dependent oxidoreductase